MYTFCWGTPEVVGRYIHLHTGSGVRHRNFILKWLRVKHVVCSLQIRYVMLYYIQFKDYQFRHGTYIDRLIRLAAPDESCWYLSIVGWWLSSCRVTRTIVYTFLCQCFFSLWSDIWICNSLSTCLTRFKIIQRNSSLAQALLSSIVTWM